MSRLVALAKDGAHKEEEDHGSCTITHNGIVFSNTDWLDLLSSAATLCVCPRSSESSHNSVEVACTRSVYIDGMECALAYIPRQQLRLTTLSNTKPLFGPCSNCVMHVTGQ